jgi:2-methylcitrate dehydratase PrpD
VQYEDLPSDVIESTKLRILDVIGLAFAGAETAFGRSTIAAAKTLSPSGPSRIFGAGDAVAAPTAAFTNAALSQALEYDDTHNESIVHMSSPAVAASLALAGLRNVTGRELILSIAVANEISCRVGSVSSGQFHRRGFHPTGLFAPFGIAAGSARSSASMRNASPGPKGTAGQLRGGMLECWVDGTQTKFLHSGFAAQSGLTARSSPTPASVDRRRCSKDDSGCLHRICRTPPFRRTSAASPMDSGTHWESRNSSFKPFPTAHVLHPVRLGDSALRAQGVRADDVVRIECPVAEFNVSIVCEPVAEKRAPATQAHCRVCLQYTMAEALYAGSLGKNAYSEDMRLNPEVLALARKVEYSVDPAFPGPGRFKGAVRVTLKDGRVLDEIEEYNRGSAENPMSDAELRAKFDDNAGGFLSGAQRDRLAQEIGRAENLPNVQTLVDLTIGMGILGVGVGVLCCRACSRSSRIPPIAHQADAEVSALRSHRPLAIGLVIAMVPVPAGCR